MSDGLPEPFIAYVGAIWAEVLQCPAEEISPDDNFFTLGGSSLQAFMVNSLIEERLGAMVPPEGLPISAIAAEPSLAAFADRLRRELTANGGTTGAASDEEGEI